MQQHQLDKNLGGALLCLDDVNYLSNAWNGVAGNSPGSSGQLRYTQDRRLVFSSPDEEISFPLQLLLEFDLLAKSGSSASGASLGGSASSGNLQSRLGLSVRLKTSQAVLAFDAPGRCSDQAAQLVALVTAEKRRLPGSLQQLLDGLDASGNGATAGQQSSRLYRFSLEAEFIRFGAVNNANWRLWTANEDYGVCDTYPRLLYVPAAVPDQVLLDCAKFRSRGRLPVLTYLLEHRQSALCRCSQPLVGLSARSATDEQVVQAISDANPNPEGRRLYVVDTRPMANAIGNRAMGKGYESMDNYKNAELSFCQIENIHVMRDSQKALAQACLPVHNEPSVGAHAWASRVNKSGWLKHVRAILTAAQFIADRLLEGSSVLVHCSDGWDRTAQTAALAQLLIDPHYRTLHGFQDLIEKEWLSFGHKFSDRCAHFAWSDESSPVFSQFADCVHQLCRLFPTRFEFNEAYLLALVDATYSCEFATFLGNCERDRAPILRQPPRLPCFWTHALERRAQFVNPMFSPDSPSAGLAEPLRLGPLPRCLLRPWLGLQNPWRRGQRRPQLPAPAPHLPDGAALYRRLAQSAERVACLEAELELRRRRGRDGIDAPPAAAFAGRWEPEPARLSACGVCRGPQYEFAAMRRRANCHACGRLGCVSGGCLETLNLPQQAGRGPQPALLCPRCRTSSLGEVSSS